VDAAVAAAAALAAYHSSAEDAQAVGGAPLLPGRLAQERARALTERVLGASRFANTNRAAFRKIIKRHDRVSQRRSSHEAIPG